eukprot:387954-Rhodomonas_salina.3
MTPSVIVAGRYPVLDESALQTCTTQHVGVNVQRTLNDRPWERHSQKDRDSRSLHADGRVADLCPPANRHSRAVGSRNKLTGCAFKLLMAGLVASELQDWEEDSWAAPESMGLTNASTCAMHNTSASRHSPCCRRCCSYGMGCRLMIWCFGL